MSTDKLNWAIIEDMGWGEQCSDYRAYNAIKRKFMEDHNERVAKNLEDFVSARFRELASSYDKHVSETGKQHGNYGGDDSFGDMVHHVIGLGEDIFHAVLADLSLLDGINAVESFSYCIPHTSENINDYDDIDIKVHVQRAKQAIKELAEIASQGIGKDSMNVLRELMTRFLCIIEQDVPAALDGLDDGSYDRYSKFGNDHSRYSAMFANYISDVKNYLG